MQSIHKEKAMSISNHGALPVANGWERLAVALTLFFFAAWANAQTPAQPAPPAEVPGEVPAEAMAEVPAETPASKLPAGAVQSRANGRIELRANTQSPLYVEFDRSPTLTRALAAALEAKGFSITPDRSAAKAALTIRGDVVLTGGPVFYRGVKVAMGEATEKALLAAAGNRTTTAAEAVQAATTLALQGAAYKFAVAPFWRGLALGRMAEALGDATGISGTLNKALTGDPRGICLSRCDEWNKVKQSAYAFVSLSGPEGKQDIRVLATALSDTLAPEEVVIEALTSALSSIELRPASESAK